MKLTKHILFRKVLAKIEILTVYPWMMRIAKVPFPIPVTKEVIIQPSPPDYPGWPSIGPLFENYNELIGTPELANLKS